MKKTNFLIYLLCLSTLGIVSCSDDDNTDISPNNTSTDTQGNTDREEKDDNKEDESKEVTLEVVEFKNLPATVATEAERDQMGQITKPETGAYTKFDFETGKITTDENDWDIAFRTTAIIVNGGENTGTTDEPDRTKEGAIGLTDGLFDEITAVKDVKLKQDSKENGFALTQRSGQGWYSYDFRTNVIGPIPGKILIVKTSEGNYAKVEILSYYKDNPSEITDDDKNNGVRYYTFKYSGIKK